MLNVQDEFINSIAACIGFDKKEFITAHQQEPPTSVRRSPFKESNFSQKIDAVPWCQQGEYLASRPQFIFDPYLHGGGYYVQEPSSMFVDYVLRQINDFPENKIILDLCAAPGGKSTIVSSFLNNQGLLVANETIRSRANILLENITKWNSFNAVITNNDPGSFGRLPGFFDLVLVDAPCSGSGLFRKDPHSIKEWSPASVNLCAARQKRILSDVMPSIKTNGYLIYCTCSYSVEENEQILDWLVDNFKLETQRIPIPSDWGIVETQSEHNKAFGYRFYPYKLRGEGFFLSLLKKTNYTESYRSAFRQIKTVKPKSILSKWVKITEDVLLTEEKENWKIVPKSNADLISLLHKYLNVISSGVQVGKIIHDDLIPDHQLSMSAFLSEEVNHISLDLEAAICYLRKGDFLPRAGFRGWALVSYNSINLGWIKILANRINNYYPKDWRILKEFDSNKN